MTDQPPIPAGLPPETQISPLRGIAAIALDLAMKYHDAAVIKDGTMYQQLKLEQKEIHPITFDMVLATAQRIEMHLLTAEQRMAPILSKLVLDVIEDVTKDFTEEPPEGGGL